MARETVKHTPNVRFWLTLLRSKVVQHDQKMFARETARGGRGNIYRLGLLLEAASRVEADVCECLDNNDPEAIRALLASLMFNFNFTFPPLMNVLKQIEAWETKKKLPSLVK